MQRDSTRFPDDENGDILFRMYSDGDDLSAPRDVDFNVVLPDRAAAKKFGDHFHKLGYKVTAEKARTVPELPWDVNVVKHMLPTHEGVTAFEAELDAVASPLGGRNDGWGCFEQK